MGADRVQILNFGDVASIISLAIQIWEKTSGKIKEASEAQKTWDLILQGGEADLDKALGRWEEDLGQKISTSDASEVVEFARTQLALARPFSQEKHNHWDSLRAVFAETVRYCLRNRIFDLRGRNGFLTVPLTGEAFYALVKADLSALIAGGSTGETRFKSLSRTEAFLFDIPEPKDPASEEPLLPVTLRFRVNYTCGSGYNLGSDSRRGEVVILPGSEANRIALLTTLDAFESFSRRGPWSRSIPRPVELPRIEFLISADSLNSISAGLRTDLEDFTSELRADEEKLEKEVQPEIDAFLKDLSEKK